MRPAVVWGALEKFVAARIVEKYARAAQQAGDRVKLVTLPGTGHFELASPFSPAWPTVRAAIRALLGGQLPP